MTAEAGDFCMRAPEWEMRLCVIEPGCLELRCLMALGAVFTKLAVVRIVAAVAINAFVRRLPILLSSLVATGAGGHVVRPVQREVGTHVVKCLGNETDRIRIPPFMLRMTGIALGGLRCAPMETLSGSNIAGNVGMIVTVETELPLARLVSPVMAQTALLLDVRMGAREGAWHQELFELGAMRRNCQSS
jgi:hypothetical protein